MRRVFRIAEPWTFSTKGFDSLEDAISARLRTQGITTKPRFYFGLQNGADVACLDGAIVTGKPKVMLCVEVLESDHEERYALDGFPAAID